MNPFKSNNIHVNRKSENDALISAHKDSGGETTIVKTTHLIFHQGN